MDTKEQLTVGSSFLTCTTKRQNRLHHSLFIAVTLLSHLLRPWSVERSIHVGLIPTPVYFIILPIAAAAGWPWQVPLYRDACANKSSMHGSDKAPLGHAHEAAWLHRNDTYITPTSMIVMPPLWWRNKMTSWLCCVQPKKTEQRTRPAQTWSVPCVTQSWHSTPSHPSLPRWSIPCETVTTCHGHVLEASSAEIDEQVQEYEEELVCPQGRNLRLLPSVNTMQHPRPPSTSCTAHPCMAISMTRLAFFPELNSVINLAKLGA